MNRDKQANELCGAYTGYASAGYPMPPSAVPRECHLSQLENRLNELESQIGTLVIRSRETADRVLGTRPESVNGAGDKSAAAQSALGKIASVTDRISQLIRGLDSNIERLEQL